MARRRIHLWDAIPDTPDMCRTAVLDAVRTYREEKVMWRPSKMILAAALIVALLCGTAYAIVNYYSVRDYVADGKTSAAFEENIVPLERSVTSHGLTFTMGDAIFDGTDLAFTMNIAVAEDASPMFVWPDLRAYCGETELSVDFLGSDVFNDLGIFIPNYVPEYRLLSTGDQGAEASIFGKKPDGDVTWRYTISLYRPTGEAVQIRDYDPDTETYAQWEDYLRSVHKEGKIGYIHNSYVTDWISAATSDMPEGASYADRILHTGLFELADTVVFEFTTAAPEKKSLPSAQTFTFDDFTLTVTSIEQTFMQVDYKLEVVFNEKQGHEHYVEQWYDIFDQNETELRRRSAMLELDEDKIHCTVTGSVERISDEPLTSLTFVLDPYEWPENKEIPTFTVDLTK